MNLNSVEYYYIRNAQGDIIGLFVKTGAQVVAYTYDTWGKLISTTGSLASTVGVKNEYRYRGYRYDTETGLYYLQSRYYSPDWGRFINCDNLGGEIGDLLSHNVFAYCKNNPVNMCDPDGHWSWKNTFQVIAAVVVVAVVVACVVNPGLIPFVMSAVVDAYYYVGATITTASYYASQVVPKVVGKAAGNVEKATSESNCFVAGTLVVTQDGQKPIENIKPGDKVYSENPETGQKEYKEVKQIFVHEVNTLVHVSIGDTKLDTTEGHRFWIVDKGWVEAKDLKSGDKVLDASGKVVSITDVKVEKLKQKVKVYNFEVADFHTYFVSNIGVLVHNDCNSPKNMSPEGAGRKGAFNAAKKALGIPKSQQPLKILENINKQDKVVPGRVYDFGNNKMIRDDVIGHIFPDGAELGRHFNVGKLHFFY